MPGSPVTIFLILWQGIGVCVVASLVYALSLRRVAPGTRRKALAAAIFGMAAAVSMLSGSLADTGILFDARNLMVACASMLGGAIGLAAALPCILLRATLGGSVWSGVAGICAAAAIGYWLGKWTGIGRVPRPLAWHVAAGPAIAMHVAASAAVEGATAGAVPPGAAVALWLALVPLYSVGLAVLRGTVWLASGSTAPDRA